MTDDQPLTDRPPPLMREERGEHGLLPPPPERFPQRALPPPAKPAAKPTPVKRAAATPLPKAKPVVESNKPATEGVLSSPGTASPASQEAPASKPDARALPH